MKKKAQKKKEKLIREKIFVVKRLFETASCALSLSLSLSLAKESETETARRNNNNNNNNKERRRRIERIQKKFTSFSNKVERKNLKSETRSSSFLFSDGVVVVEKKKKKRGVPR